MQPTVIDDLSLALTETEQVLRDEHEALCRLDAVAIEEATAKKLLLRDRLAALGAAGKPAASARKRLVAIKKAAQQNHGMLLHARACIQGAIDVVAGRRTGPCTYRKAPPSGATTEPLRVNVKG
jgi:hypothetical protein